jgi:hypothetical protein
MAKENLHECIWKEQAEEFRKNIDKTPGFEDCLDCEGIGKLNQKVICSHYIPKSELNQGEQNTEATDEYTLIH